MFIGAQKPSRSPGAGDPVMKSFARFFLSALLFVVALPQAFAAGNYRNFKVAVYVPEFTMQKMKDPAWLESTWKTISAGVKVDKIYIETHRNRVIVSDELIEQVKKFFTDRGVEVAGGIAFVADEPSGFVTYCYTDPKDREFVKKITTVTARHFDEIILDDFFFTTSKSDSDIAAKGKRSWTNFRLDLMREAAKNLVLAPARAANPKVKVVIKFPNWYEHFQGNGFDLDQEPRMFDGIYTGTETRDPERTDQQLQEYQSYQIMRYFDNIAPGRNGGGWVDIFAARHPDRYAEQLWNTMFSKTGEITLFYWEGLVQAVEPGERSAWKGMHTSFDYDKLVQSCCADGHKPVFADVAGDALRHADAVVGHLGKPTGLKSYKPYQSRGEDFLHNYLGMIGIPIDLSPGFPTDADVVLLTESAKFDPAVVAKIKGTLVAGKDVVITSGLLQALQGKGIEDVAEIGTSGRKLAADSYVIGGRRAAGTTPKQAPILFPEVDFLTNDSWAIVRGSASGKMVPLVVRTTYSKGRLFVWAIPDNFTDLYRLPQPTLTGIKENIAPSLPVQLDAPGRVALFTYDNGTIIVESYLDEPAAVNVLAKKNVKQLRNLESGETIPRADAGTTETRNAFPVTLTPHSFLVLRLEE